MSENIEITPFNAQTDLPRVEEIFFLTAAVQQFSSEEARDKFKYKYLGYYLVHYPQLALVARYQNRVLGYCLGADQTTEAFYPHQPHLALFSDLFVAFPAHLHINLHPESQGLGIGAKLIGVWEKKLAPSVKGMHIMTDPQARNTRFYRRLGLDFEVVRKYQNHDILFMGKNF